MWVRLSGENKIKIVQELSQENVLEKLESDCGNSLGCVKRQVAFCARWSLDNLCELFCCLCPVNLCFVESLHLTYEYEEHCIFVTVAMFVL